MPITRSSRLDARRFRRRTTYLQLTVTAGFLVTVAFALLQR
ncbi:hypothetical protein [Quadrisphaera granulorum]|nr:hypothetical protein [Quadrisphaera granulorum]